MNNKDLKKATISGLGFRFAERIIAQLVSTLVSIVLARILIPEDYGIVALVLILITLLNVFVDSGLGSALIQKKDADQTDFSTVFWSSVTLSLLLYVALFLGAPLFAKWYGKDVLTPIIRIMGLRLPIAAVNSVQHAFISKKLMFKKFFWATITGTVLSGVVGVWMALTGFGPWALVFQYLVNISVDTLFLWFTIKWRPLFKFSWQRFKELFSFGWKVLASGFLTSVYEEIRSLIIAGKYSTADLAYYTKGQQFPKLLANNVGTTITNVMFPVLSIYQDDLQRLKPVVRRSMRVCSYVMFPLLVGFAAIAESFVIVILTDKWLPVVPYIYLFCVFYLFKPLKVINQSSIKAIGKSNVYLALNIIEKTLGVILIVVTMDLGVIYLSLSAVVTYAIAAIMEMVANGVFLKYTFKEQLSDLLAPTLLSIAMCIPVFLLYYIEISVYLLLILQMMVGAISYIVFSKLFHVETYTYLKKTIKTYLIEYRHKKKKAK